MASKIEKDPKYIPLLRNELSNYDNIELINEDALEIDWPKANKIVSNIPYEISSKIMDKLSIYHFEIAIICFQKEFAERLRTQPNEKNYSKLSVFSNYYFDMKLRMNVKATAFYPKPKVDSQIVEIKKNKKIELENESDFFNLIKAIFCYKRKTLKNSLLNSKNMLQKELNIEKIDSELLQGDYLACHTFGWAEFEIAPETQELLVTVYGVDAYGEIDLLADPNGVINQIPRVVSQFMVHPNRTMASDSDNSADVGL